MTETAAGWLGTSNLDTVALNPDSFLKNVKSDITNAFAYIEVSDEAYRLADLYSKAARELVRTADIFARDKTDHERAKVGYHDALEALRAEVTKCLSSAMGRALGY